MIGRSNYKILLDEIEIMISCTEPYHDSLIDFLPPLFDEIQESIPEDFFLRTSEIIEKCRDLVAEYRRKGEEDAYLVLESLLSLVAEIRRITSNLSSAKGYNTTSSRKISLRQKDENMIENQSREDDWMDDPALLYLVLRDVS